MFSEQCSYMGMATGTDDSYIWYRKNADGTPTFTVCHS